MPLLPLRAARDSSCRARTRPPRGIAAAVRRGQRTIEHAESIMQVERSSKTRTPPTSRESSRGFGFRRLYHTDARDVRSRHSDDRAVPDATRPVGKAGDAVRASRIAGLLGPVAERVRHTLARTRAGVARGTGEVSSAVCLDAPPDRSARCIGCSDSRRTDAGAAAVIPGSHCTRNFAFSWMPDCLRMPAYARQR